MEPDKIFCPHCGKQNRVTNRYCDECGFDIPKFSFHESKDNSQSNSEREPEKRIKETKYYRTRRSSSNYSILVSIILFVIVGLAVYLIFGQDADKFVSLETSFNNIKKKLEANSSKVESSITKSNEDYFCGEWYSVKTQKHAFSIRYDGENYIEETDISSAQFMLQKKNSLLLIPLVGIGSFRYDINSKHIFVNTENLWFGTVEFYKK